MAKVRAVKFYNFSDEDFEWTWDSVPYNFKAKETMMMEDWKARHFAKHLVDREMNKLKIATNHFSRPTYLKKCLIDGEAVEAVSDEKLKFDLAKQESVKPFCDKCDSKGRVHKKECPNKIVSSNIDEVVN